MDTAPIGIVGTRLTATMAVLRLGDGSLLLYSPLEATPERRAAVEAIGEPKHIYAPNLFHHLHVGSWASAFSGARVHAPAGLAKKRPDLRIDREHGAEPEPAFSGVVHEVFIAGFRLAETVLLYRPARALLVADLVHNVGRPEGLWTKAYTKAMGFYDRVALSRAIRAMGFHDRAAARRSIDEVLRLDFDRLVVGHGRPLESGAPTALAHAFEWLPR